MPDIISERTFVPRDVDPAQWDQLQPLYQALADRPLDSVKALKRWLAELSELTAVVSEYGARRHIERACHTDDPEIEKAFLHFVEQILPKLKPLQFALRKRFLDSPHQQALTGEAYEVLRRQWQAEVSLFREENVPLATQATKLVSEYDKLNGAMVVEYQGRKQTLQQLGKYLEEPDRQVREQTWRLAAERRLEDRDAIESLFDQLLGLRGRMAGHADKRDFREYSWAAMDRFDYRPEDCLAMAEAVERICVPMVEQLDEQRRERMELAALRPWDLSVDVYGRAPLQPFNADDPSELVERARQTLARIDGGLADEFARLKLGRNLDLDSRPGKRAGGFQAGLHEIGEPFIFMNATGVHRDVETILHEAGHAFHFVWAHRAQPLVFLRHAPIEFCEVASMSMELMAWRHLDVFYGDEPQRHRAQRAMLEGIVRIFPWIATIDSFQHWLYTHPGHSAAERRDYWLGLMDRFSSRHVDWTGLDEVRAYLWHKQLHLFHHPFYYVEYGIAQLGALQLWARYEREPAATLADYRAALALGGSRRLPALFESARLRFDLTERTLEPVMQALWRQIQSLPE